MSGQISKVPHAGLRYEAIAATCLDTPFSLRFFVPTPLEGGGTLYSNGFFCSVNFRRSIYSSYRVETDIIRKLVQRRIWNQKDFSDFRFLQGVIEV